MAEIEVTVRCGCSRTMHPDATGGGRYRCGCGARVSLSGLPRLTPGRCALPRGNRVCNGPKRPDALACEPCSVLIAKDVLRDPEVAVQLGTDEGRISYNLARQGETERLIALAAEMPRADRDPSVHKAPVVYYCELRPGIVKIGTTMDLGARMSTLHVPAGAVLAAEPGHYELEKARHREFAHLRIGAREDFRVDQGLRDHIEGLVLEHGEPYALAARQRAALAEDPSQS